MVEKHAFWGGVFQRVCIPLICWVSEIRKGGEPFLNKGLARPPFYESLFCDSLLDVSDDVVCVFDADRETDQVGTYACLD